MDAIAAGALYAALTTPIHDDPVPAPRTVTPHVRVEVDVPSEIDLDKRNARQVRPSDLSGLDIPEWDDYIGQSALKRELRAWIAQALATVTPLPHVLLASGRPGIGKTTMARLIAKTLDVQLVELVPPFNIWTLASAAEELLDGDILFIDEIHKLADNGGKGAEILLKALEEHTLYMPDGEVIELSRITVIGATTEPDRLPEPVVDRFPLRPSFEEYTDEELCCITNGFAQRHGLLFDITPKLSVAIALAGRGTPRVIENMVRAIGPLRYELGRVPTPEELLAFVRVEPDGMTSQHINYVTAMRTFFPREDRSGGVEYVAGEAAMMQLLRESKPGIARLERFLIERGLLDRTPRGRRLTDRGIARAEQFIAEGKGVRDV